MKLFLTVLASVVAFTFTAHAQRAQQAIQLSPGDVDVKKIEFSVQPTPSIEAGGVKSKNVPNPRDWLEVEVEFEVKGARDAVVPELLFRYYVGFQDSNGQPRTLTGDVQHVFIPTGQKTYSAVYVAPSTLGEITGNFRKFQQSAVKAVGVEVIYNGVIVGGTSTLSGSSAKFWQSTGTQPGVLSKADTPFALLWIDRYAEAVKGR